MIRRLFCCGTLLACAYGTGQRVPQWHDNLSVWGSAVDVSPTQPRALNNLAGAYVEADQPAEAIGLLWQAQAQALDPRRPAIRQKEDWLLATTNLVVVLVKLQRWELARDQLRSLQRVQPTFGPAKPLLRAFADQ